MPRGVPRLTEMHRRRGGWSVPQPTTYRGYRYRSRAEANYARTLDLRLAAKDIKAWERPLPFRLMVSGNLCGHYTPDFLVTLKDGTKELIEVKGWAARDFVLRLKVFKALYPEWKIRVIDGQGRPWKATRSARALPGLRRKGAA